MEDADLPQSNLLVDEVDVNLDVLRSTIDEPDWLSLRWHWLCHNNQWSPKEPRHEAPKATVGQQLC
jgi:hypothetical protein